VVTIGKITGGTARNVICDRVEIEGTLRTLKPETRAMLKEKLMEIPAAIAAAMGGSQFASSPLPQANLSAYSTTPFPLEKAHEVSSILGFTVLPQKLPNTRIAGEQWSESGKYLSVTNDEGIVRVFFNQGDVTLLQPPALNQEEAQAIARLFINNLNLLPDSISLNLYRVQYAMTQGYGSNVTNIPRSANTVTLTFTYQYKNYPLIVRDNLLHSIQVVIGSDKNVIKATLDLPPIIDNVPKSVQIPSLNEAKQRVAEGRAVLFEAIPSKVFEGADDPDYTQVAITESDYVFVYNPEVNMLIPTYRFRGIAPDKTVKNLMYQTTYLVPAME
jgi:hypothetical protein